MAQGRRGSPKPTCAWLRGYTVDESPLAIHGPANLGAVFRLVRGEFNARVRRCVEPSHGRYLTEPAEQPIELSLQAVSQHTYQ